MNCKLHLYDNVCIHIQYMYLWLWCSILVYHNMWTLQDETVFYICIYVYNFLNVHIYGFKATSKDIIICKHCKMKLYSMYLCVQLHQCIYLWLQSIHISKDGLQITFIWLFVCTYSTYVFMCTTSSMYLCLFKRWIANYIYMTICVCIFYILCIYGYAAIHILVYHNM